MMTQTIQQTTQKLIDLLPEDAQYYRPDELRSWGFPSYIVDRIRIELERNLAESMIPPKTDWANVETEAVQYAWQQFVEAIRDETRLPASYARAVVETAVADVLDILITPRQNVSEVIFGNDKKLSSEQLSKRVKAVTVYPHFSALLVRYMQKKELETLTKDRCDQIVLQADTKMTYNYSPLSWAQMLEPLFDIMDGKVDPTLFRLFFEDREQKEIAGIFESMDESLTRAEFIEALSSPALTKDRSIETPAEDSLKRKKEKQPTEESSETKISDKKNGSEEDSDQRDQQPKTVPESEKVPDPTEEIEQEAPESVEQNEQTINGNFGQEESVASLDDEQEDNNSINAVFAGEEEVVNEEGEAKEVENNSLVEEDNESEQEEAGEKKEEDTNEEDAPMWMRFMSEEDKAALEEQEEASGELTITGYKEESDSSVDKDGFIEEPIIDLTEEESSDKEKEIEKLNNQLSDQQERFTEDIFGGSEQAYEEAIEKIASYDDWRSASKYIQEEVFKRNMVDLYSESAVSFTDRLQDYFLEKEN